MPYVTRRTESFGVSIPEEIYHSDELIAMRKRYAFQTGIFGVVLLAVQWVFSAYFAVSFEDIAFVFALFIFLIGSFIIYLRFHYQMESLKEEKNWRQTRSEAVAVDTGFRDKKIAFSNWWFTIPVIIVLGTMIMSFVYYDQIPDKIPMQYDFDGNVTNWAVKSYRTMLLFPALQLFMTALFIFINSIIAKSKQQVDSANPEKSIQQNVKFRRRWSEFTIIMGTAMVLLFAFTQLSLIITIDVALIMVVPLVVVAGMIIGVIALSFTTGQGGSRIKTATSRQGKKINRDDDRYWKLGQFYFNPNDPSIWVEKRFGIGWTVNFAHPAGWGSLLGIILVGVLIAVLS